MLAPRKLTAPTLAAIIASVMTISLTTAYAQGSGKSGHGGESASHSDSGGCGGCGGEEGGGDEGGGKGGAKGHRGTQGGFDRGHGGSGQSLRGIFHGMDSQSGADHYPGGDEHHDR